MANSFTAANVAQEAISTFGRVKNLSTTRYLVLKINGEHIDLVDEQRGSVSLRQDYNSMKAHAERLGSCYFVFRFGPSQWTLITYCPDTCVAREKMLYSSTQGSLTRALDPSNTQFTDAMHASDLEELSYTHYESQQKIVGSSALSSYEKEHLEILASEDAERKERSSLHAQHLSAQTQKDSRLSSGYHSVAIPFADSAVRMLTQFKSAGPGSLVSLCVSDGKDSIEGVSVSSVASAASLSGALDASNPRFYFWKNAGKTCMCE
jgi:Cofilin/tropomyosin-type actin-binding protein